MPVTINGTTGIVTPALVNGTALSFRNKIINGNFAINQRGYVSGTATSVANQYTLDRWRVVTSGQNITFTASSNGNIVTAPAGGIEQVIESLNIEGGTYTLSWTGTATGAVNGTIVANGGQVTLPANTNATIKFSSGAVSLVQLEEGSVVTPFENRPIGIELALCQRYYRYFDTVGQKFESVSATLNMQFMTENLLFGSPMRSAPTGTIGNVYYYNAGTARAEVIGGSTQLAGHGSSGVPTNTSCAILYLASGSYTMYGWYAEDIKLNAEL